MTLLRINNRILKKNGTLLTEPWSSPVDPYNPYNLDPGVMRLAFYDEPEQYNPNSNLSAQADGTCVYVGEQYIDGFTMYVWDYIPGPDGTGLDNRMEKLQKSFWLVSWNTVGYTNTIRYTFRGSRVQRIINPIDLYNIGYGYITQTATEMFQSCTQLVDVAPGIRIDDAEGLFRNCTYLTEIPVFDWSCVPGNLATAFANCTAVHSGMKRLYDNWSSVQSHYSCFANCGDHSAVANEELAQIPNDWKS
jgi:hypothetical protein